MSISRRFVSSDVGAIWRQTTGRLVEAPVGSFDSKMWSESRSTILYWLEQSDGDSIRMPLSLLDRMCEEEEASLVDGNRASDVLFNSDLLNLVINHWRKMVSEQPSFLRKEIDLQPQLIVDKMSQYHSNSTNLKPNTQTYAMVIDGASSFTTQKDDPNDGVLVAERLLDWAIENALDSPRIRPNVVSFSSMMNAWVKSWRPEAPEKVEKLLDDMKRLHMEHPAWGVIPNQVTYATAIDAWAKVGRVDRAEGLLKEMYEEGLKPNLPSFNGYLVSLARAGEMDKAESVLEQMEALYDSGELEDRPNVISYSTVLDAFAKSKDDGAAERSESILRQMIDKGVSPNTISYNSVIDAHVKSRNVERAEALLKEMHDSFVQGNPDVKPTIRTYSVVLAGWSRTRSPQAGERGEQLLDLMESLAESGELEDPDIIVYNSVLHCWAKSPTNGAAAKAKEFLVKMVDKGIEADAYSYNIVINALASEGRIDDAEAMLEGMSEAGVHPDVTAYNTLLDAWIKSSSKEASTRVARLYSRMKENSHIEPDLFTYNTLLHFYSKTGNADRAESMLDEICQEESPIEPDSISFNTVISALAQSRRIDAPQRAEAILNKMLEHGGKVRPNVITFNTVLGAWVKSKKTPQAVVNCERIFGIMNEMLEDGHKQVKPDAITYNTLINSYTLSPDEESRDKAESIFYDMQRRYEAGDRRLQPTVHTFGSLINGWSRSFRPDAGQMAEKYLRMLIEKTKSGEIKGQPRVFEFTATIRAWANSDDPRALFKADEMLHLLLQQLKQGNRGAHPDSRIFGTILMMVASSKLPNKSKYADKLVSLMKDYQIKPDRFNVQQLQKCYERRIAI
jgi:pentatricopeptide repeat protein